MSIEDNKQFARDFMAAMSNGDWAFIENAFVDDAVVWVAGAMPISGTHTKDFVLEATRRTADSFPDGMTLTPKDMTAEGDRVAIEAETYGKHISGKIYNNHFHILMVIRDRKVHVWKEYMDTAHANDVFFGDAEAARP